MNVSTSEPLSALQESLRPLRERLFAHPVYGLVDSLPRLRTFMERHVFAVWDFMSLLKQLQRKLTCVDVPWLPSGHPTACRLVNDIVLGEESDDDGQGSFLSHFELYAAAMAECGADVGPITRFQELLRRGRAVDAALAEAGAPEEARRFTGATLAVAERGTLCEVAAAFTFGREDVVPEMFRRIVSGLAKQPAAGLSRFSYYLDRHIEVDEGQHGPMAHAMLSELCGRDEVRWREALTASRQAIESRLAFWDGTAQAIRAVS